MPEKLFISLRRIDDNDHACVGIHHAEIGSIGPAPGVLIEAEGACRVAGQLLRLSWQAMRLNGYGPLKLIRRTLGSIRVRSD